MVAITSGNTPLSAAPMTCRQSSHRTAGLVENRTPSGSSRPSSEAMMITGLRPKRSDEPGTRKAIAMDAMPNADMITLIC